MSEIERLKEGVECDSCGGMAWEPELGDAFCHGCGRTICQACTCVFAHFEGGHHGTGDPDARVRELLEKLGLLKRLQEEDDACK